MLRECADPQVTRKLTLAPDMGCLESTHMSSSARETDTEERDKETHSNNKNNNNSDTRNRRQNDRYHTHTNTQMDRWTERMIHIHIQLWMHFMGGKGRGKVVFLYLLTSLFYYRVTFKHFFSENPLLGVCSCHMWSH